VIKFLANGYRAIAADAGLIAAFFPAGMKLNPGRCI
jgi:hypothetical protein